VSGVGTRGQVEMSVYRVGFLLVIQALYEITNFNE
jgi:hypothetical protein